MKKNSFLFISIIFLFVYCFGPQYRKQADLYTIYEQATHWAEIDSELFQYNAEPPDSLYGRDESHHIKVAYRSESDTFAGPRMEHYYLAHLECDCGGGVEYYRAGSCCPVPSEHGWVEYTALLDVYHIRCMLCSKKIILYLNMYDHDTVLYAPVGFRIKLGK